MDKLGTAIVYAIGLLIAGAGSAMLRKVLFQLSGPTINGGYYPFIKPWWTTTESGFVTSFCYVVYLFVKWYNRSKIIKHKKKMQKQQQQWQQQQQLGKLPLSPFMRTPSPQPPGYGYKEKDSDLQQPLLGGLVQNGMIFMDQRQQSADGQNIGVTSRQNSTADTDRQKGGSQRMYGTPDGIHRRINTPTFDASSDTYSTATIPRKMSYTEKSIIVKKHLPRNEAPYHNTMKFGLWAKGEYGKLTLRKVSLLIAPALLQQQAIGIQGIGLRYVSASVSQMISGSCIIFTAIMAIVFLKRKLNNFHWIGITLCMVGVALVSLASFLSSSKEKQETGPMEKWQAAYGIGMTLLSQIIQAAQLVTEEAMLGDLNLHPLQVVGIEGAINFTFIVIIVLPIIYYVPGPDPSCGCEENTIDTLYQLSHSSCLFWTNFCYVWTVFGTNLFGVLVTSVLGSVFRAVLLTARTALVWGADLAVYYAGIGGGTIGESWSKTSYVQAVGFIVLLIGTVLYAQGSSKIIQQTTNLTHKFAQKLDEKRRNSQDLLYPRGPSPVPSITAVSVTTSAAIAMPVPPASSPRRQGSNFSQLLGSTPPEIVKNLIDDIVSDASYKQNWTHQFTVEVGKEFKKQIASGKLSPSVVGSLRSGSSWLLHPQDVDKKDFSGAGQYINPFLPGVPVAGKKSSKNINITGGTYPQGHSYEEGTNMIEEADEEQEEDEVQNDDDIIDEQLNAELMNSFLGYDSTLRNSSFDAFTFASADHAEILRGTSQEHENQSKKAQEDDGASRYSL